MLKKLRLLPVLFLGLLLPMLGHAAKRDFYQIKVYHLKNEDQERKMDEFLKNAYLPALHRAGIKDVGIFKPVIAPETNPVAAEKLIYVFIPFSSRDGFFDLDSRLKKDSRYLEDGGVYADAKYSEAPYERIETILLTAFEKNPHYGLPKLNSPKKERIYELRSYEGHTEKVSANKIKMFNEGDEVGLFKRLNFNAVFYAEVVAGSTMPNLMYMTTFENRADRDTHWSTFGKDEYWKKLSGLTEYQNNVSKNVTKFLYPTDYSDI
jgi:hypothetical protein